MEDVMRQLSAEELGALCSNLQKACNKQLRSEEAALFGTLAAYYDKQRTNEKEQDYQGLLAAINADLSNGYAEANTAAEKANDRGAKRALLWGEKASKLLKALMVRYEKQGSALLENTNVWVCEICGFIYVGDNPPSLCPICKVPSFKIHPIQKEAL
ncbi:rubredoxin-like domain-containing protein [Sphaerochaeta sp. S2]|uniref:rubredoxin-like domain-containing protein n=1 Tax=Sphaerochaeta sp. S2 TaxID=2798868 RepID=UPI0018E99157|nr:rubredoxin [Sphaerochaeta sp. S2]MBJ2355485.1 rubredoxin [Sphaerochaeta sp. S2]